MERAVAAHLTGRVGESAEVVLAVTVAHGPQLSEELRVTVDGRPVEVTEISADAGTRLHVCRLPVGDLQVDYSATVRGAAPVEPVSALDRITYTRPSRYCDSDTMAAVALAEFGSLAGKPLLDAVSSWVGRQLRYVSGWSRPTDGAVDTFLARAGVCRDFAHLVVTLLRARNVPARVAAVYAPGLSPMDFHAVAEAFLDGAWFVVDATTLAPRSSMLRIATGRDAADTAFMTTLSGVANLTDLSVEAVVDSLPDDDLTELVQLT
ncbi:transglutaminase family protein [Actinotalea sp.]|uniref:transglutaminase-like domain-containing protein n=1 Tax=Actinotalea sp. TaxID=1872145 RepID=UPI0035668BDC